MSKFKIGDTVISNKLADSVYSITRNNWIGIVVDIDVSDYYTENGIKVIAQPGTSLSIYGEEFVVNPKCFDLLQPAGDEEFMEIMFEKE